MVYRLPQPVLMLVTEPMAMALLANIVRNAAAGGVNMVQLRDKTLPRSELSRTAAVLKQALGETILVVNGCPSAAADAHIHGVHLPEEGIRTELARKRLGHNCLVGRSVHSIEAAMEAERDGADYLLAGTIFASRSHPDRQPAGLNFLCELCESVSLPVLAIGGITPDNAPECIKAGAAGIAVLSPIMQAADPRSAADEFRASLAEC